MSISLSKKEMTDVESAREFLSDYAIREKGEFNVSKVDCEILAFGQVTEYPIVTDDGRMRLLAETFDIKIMKMLDLLKLMLDCNHIDQRKIRTIINN